MTYPATYSEATYCDWHERCFPEDAPVIARLDSLRNGLKQDTGPQMERLARLLDFMSSYAMREYNAEHRTVTSYEVPLSAILGAPPVPQLHDRLFKTTSSTLNKLWRVNQKQWPHDPVTVANIGQRITDLVRTYVVASTLDSARFLAHRLASYSEFVVHDKELAKELEPHIASVRFDSNMQMDKGYFAYHGLVRFRDGLAVEVQIYSGMTVPWRLLNHVFYETVRLNPPAQYDYNETETRLISLGHLLHLAECEIHRLENEMRALRSRRP